MRLDEMIEALVAGEVVKPNPEDQIQHAAMVVLRSASMVKEVNKSNKKEVPELEKQYALALNTQVTKKGTIYKFVRQNKTKTKHKEIEIEATAGLFRIVTDGSPAQSLNQSENTPGK